jgi:small subunit ribosomal protein S16
MVKVRLARHGSKKRPYYHIVVTDSQNARDGRFIEQLGTYDPAKPMAEARIDHDRLAYWVSVGAQPSESLGRVIREHKKALDAARAASA